MLRAQIATPFRPGDLAAKRCWRLGFWRTGANLESRRRLLSS